MVLRRRRTQRAKHASVLPGRLYGPHDRELLFAQRLLDGAAAWGTAFPSSHVAVALVAGVCAWRFWRTLGAAALPAAILLTLGTVYGQFHYAVDAMAGAAIAAGVLIAGWNWDADPRRR